MSDARYRVGTLISASVYLCMRSCGHGAHGQLGFAFEELPDALHLVVELAALRGGESVDRLHRDVEFPARRTSVMTVDSHRFLRLTRSFDASPERVFDAWLNLETARKWLFSSPSDEVYTAEIDARVGGKWTITARRGGTNYTGGGEYLEIDRPHRLVFTFAMLQFSPNSDRITVEIAPSGAGCILTLTQEGIDIAGELRQLPPGVEGGTEMGWRLMFDALAATLR